MTVPTAGSLRWDGHVPKSPEDYTTEHAGTRIGSREVLRCTGVYYTPSGTRSQVWRVRCDCGGEDTVRATGTSGIAPACRRCQRSAMLEGQANARVDMSGIFALLREARDRAPEVWDGDSDASIAACLELAALIRGAGHEVTLEMLGHLFGVTRQRLWQIEDAALKKCRLRGGRELRESWEHVQSRTDITWAEATDLIAWGLDDDEGE